MRRLDPMRRRLSATDNILRPQRAISGLEAIFRPSTIALIGATERSGVGRTLMENLTKLEWGGTLFPINPKRETVLGVKAYPTLLAVEQNVDLAVIATPAATVPALVRDCVEAGVPGCVIISAGFKELGPPGEALEREIAEYAGKGHIRIIGPNCLGVMNPTIGLNVTFSSVMAQGGNVAFISQSGALCTAILDWSMREKVGFSSFVSLGSMIDVDWGDLISFYGQDAKTKSIVIYMETIGDPKSFLSAAREVALTKPIIVIKAGRTSAGAAAAASHTGSLTGSDDVLEVAFRRVGVLRVDEISDLFNMASVLSKQPHPLGKKLTIVTNAGGPGVLSTDALILGNGELSTLSPPVIEKYNGFLSPHWSHGNPVDILGDATPETYSKALEVASSDEDSDGMLVILTPQAMTEPTQTAQLLKSYSKIPNKPVLASWMGGVDVMAGSEILNHAGIPCFPYPDLAAKTFNYMWKYGDNLKLLYEIPDTSVDEEEEARARNESRKIVEAVVGKGRTYLTEWESKKVLSTFGIPTCETRLAPTAEEAVQAAEAIGFPVVLKLNSETLTHKTDVGGVKLNLATKQEVHDAFEQIKSSVAKLKGAEHFLGVTVQPMIKVEGYELIIGSSLDAQFGPVLVFGAGGTLVEVFRDTALGLPPLNTTLAKRMMERTKIYKALQGIRGRNPVDMVALQNIMVRFSHLVASMPWIKEIDINPLVASESGIVALDARVILHPGDTRVRDLSYPAITPYPHEYMWRSPLKDGRDVLIRPIRPEDEKAMAEFHEGLSTHTVYMRYFHSLNLDQRIAHERLMGVCFCDYEREMTLVAEHKDEAGVRSILGVGRLTKANTRTDDVEFSLLIRDNAQKRGLGESILKRLLHWAKVNGHKRVVGIVQNSNPSMHHICKKFGFELARDTEDPNLIRTTLNIDAWEEVQ